MSLAAPRGAARALGRLARERVFFLFAPLLLPWTVVLSGDSVSLVFPWGLASAWPLPVTAVSLARYLTTLTSGLPQRLVAWPLSVVLYACALASTWSYVRPPFDDRGTAILLTVAGVVHLEIALGLLGNGQLAVPTGSILLWTLAYAVYDGDNDG